MATREQLIEDFADHKYATGEKFARLINSMKVVQEPVADPAASGTSLSFIDSIEQDADGKITATKKTLDLSNAHELNPFKGWWKTGDTLPTSGFDGAYLYFKDTTQTPAVTTIYRWNGTAYADTGTEVDESNVQTFATGQAVNTVGIDDEPTDESENLVKSGGVYAKINESKTFIGYSYENGYVMVSGGISHTPTRSVTDFIFVKGLKKIIVSTGAFYPTTESQDHQYCCFFNKDKEFTRYISNDVIPIGNQITLNDNDYYIRINIAQTNSQVTCKFIGSPYQYTEAVFHDAKQQIDDIVITTDNIGDGSITTEKLSNRSITTKKLNVGSNVIYSKSLTGYQNDVAELFISNNNALTNANMINLRYYGNTVLLRGYNNSQILWTSRYSLLGYENGKVYELKCTAQGASQSVLVNDVVGYIVFRDIEHFMANPTDLYVNDLIDINRATLLWLQPFIETYLTASGITPEIPDDAITPEKLSNTSRALTYGSGVEIIVPDIIPVVINNHIRIYWKSIVKCPNPYIYDIYAVSSNGLSHPRYFQFMSDTVGNTSVTIFVKNPAGLIIAQKTFTIKTVPVISSPSSQLNILTIGASATASGYIAGELKRRLTTNTGDGTTVNPTGLNLTNISFVGRKTGYAVTDVNLEATGGWSWLDYSTQGRPAYRFIVQNVNLLGLNSVYSLGGFDFTIVEINVTEGSGNIRCLYSGQGSIPSSGQLQKKSGQGDSTISYTSFEVETYNPFWNPNKTGGAGLDFINYANLYCNGAIGMIISHCGLNDLNRYTEATIDNLFTDYVKPFVRAFHTDFPNAKFVFSTLPLGSPNGGMGANYGANAFWNYYNVAKMLFALSKAVHNMANETEFSSYFFVADTIPSFDCENLYPTTDSRVCLRLNTTEILQSNGVHPIMEGSYTVSDAIYNCLNDIL